MFVQEAPPNTDSGRPALEIGGLMKRPVPSVEQYLVAATTTLPGPLAESMEAALTQGNFRIRAGRYSDGGAFCPIGAADAFASSKEEEAFEDQSATGSGEGRGGKVLRFAVAFDLCAEQTGLGHAVDVVRTALARRPQGQLTPG